MSNPRRRFKKILPPIASAPRPPVAGVQVKMRGERRHVLTAKPSGKIVWHPFNSLENARTKAAIQKAVQTAGAWK